VNDELIRPFLGKRKQAEAGFHDIILNGEYALVGWVLAWQCFRKARSKKPLDEK
jgi:hypothetical protein